VAFRKYSNISFHALYVDKDSKGRELEIINS